MILIDSNVLLDIFTQDASWFSWSMEQIRHWGDREQLAINPIIFAEVSVGFKHENEIETLLPSDQFNRLALPYKAAFLAGKSFQKYRKNGGTKTSPLPDFFIGAHAMVIKVPLLTRDRNRYRTYFPKLKLICP